MTVTLSLRVLSPDNMILDVEQVKSVRVRLRDNSWLSIYPGHAPLIAELLPGELVYSFDERKDKIVLATGIMQVTDNHINIFVGKNLEDFGDETDEQADRFDNLARKLMQTMVDQNNSALPSRN